MPPKPICSVSGCERFAKTRTWCATHYSRWLRTGTPEDGERSLPLAERFWVKVQFDGPIPVYAPHLGPCWLWRRGKSNGYGVFNPSGQSVGAHVWSYQFCGGVIPEGFELDHLCRVPACVRVDHLEAVPPRINVLRGIGPTAVNAQATHCPAGHPLDAANTYVIPKTGSRDCRLCAADRLRDYRARSRERGPRPVEGRVTACTNGHPYDEANTIIRKDGGRECRACARERNRAYEERKRAAAQLC